MIWHGIHMYRRSTANRHFKCGAIELRTRYVGKRSPQLLSYISYEAPQNGVRQLLLYTRTCTNIAGTCRSVDRTRPSSPRSLDGNFFVAFPLCPRSEHTAARAGSHIGGAGRLANAPRGLQTREDAPQTNIGRSRPCREAMRQPILRE